MYLELAKIRLDTSLFIHFDDKYFRTEGVLINEITGHSVCKHSDGGSAFLIRGKIYLANNILFALEIVIIADHPLSNTVEKMSTHTETAAEFLMYQQRVCCIKVLLAKKEMSALSGAIQRRKVTRNGATEQRPLAVEVVMDQHDSQYLLIVIGRRIVGVAKEIVKKELVGGVHFVPWQTIEQLAGIGEGDCRRRESRRARTS